MSPLAERTISSVHNSTAGARHVWLHLCSAHLVSALALGRDTVTLELKGEPAFQLWLVFVTGLLHVW